MKKSKGNGNGSIAAELAGEAKEDKKKADRIAKKEKKWRAEMLERLARLDHVTNKLRSLIKSHDQ